MTNDERKLLEDSAYAYGTAVRDGKEEEGWRKLMDEFTKVQTKEERDEQHKFRNRKG